MNTANLFKIAQTILCVMFLAIGAWPQNSYSVTDLGVLRGGSARVHGINLAGQAVGGSGFVYGASRHAFIWTPEQGMTDLGTLDRADISEAFSINNKGEVAGTSDTRTSIRAFVWSAQQGLRELGALAGTNSSAAYAIDNLGQVAGSSGTRAVVWTPEGKIEDLGGLPEASWSAAYGINDRGQVVGTSNTPAGPRALLWSAGAMRELGALSGDTGSRAAQINGAGMIVGASIGRNGVRAVAWTSEGIKLLGSLPAGNYSEAFGVNNAGQVVGVSDSSFGARAFLWSAATGMLDLNTVAQGSPDVVLTGAFGINDKGRIVAYGIRENTAGIHQETHSDIHMHHAGTRVFLLTPTQ